MHRCDNPPCFRYDHLLLGTHHDNNLDMLAKGRDRHGTTGPRNPAPKHGEHNGRARLTWDDVAVIRQRLAVGDSQAAIAADYAVVPATIHYIKTERNWRPR